MIGMSIKRISVLNLCHVLKPFVKSTPDSELCINCIGTCIKIEKFVCPWSIVPWIKLRCVCNPVPDIIVIVARIWIRYINPGDITIL